MRPAALLPRYAGIPPSSGETLASRRITLNGALIASRKKLGPVPIMTHELSHYFWYSRDIHFQPRWFEEGLAVWVSGGGGAETVAPETAAAAIAEGRMLRPTLDSGFWSYRRQGPEGTGIDWPMFYRQSGMFVTYLHDSDPVAFNALLQALQRHGALEAAWAEVYTDGVNAAWARFAASVRAKVQLTSSSERSLR